MLSKILYVVAILVELVGGSETIPDYQSIMLPLLKFIGDKNEHSIREAIEHISSYFRLNDEERFELLPSGQQPIIDNRVGWARTYMKKAGLLDRPRRGYLKITGRGLEVLGKNLEKIDVKYLEQYPEFIEFKTIRREQSSDKTGAITEDEGGIETQTPDELIEKGSDLINADLAQELLYRLRNSSPSFFEIVVGMLLSNMGYGECKVTGRSGDGGVDGVVNQDKLGLDKIFFQAKRFDENNPVTASMIRDFIGTLDLHGVNKGVFMTTSRFSVDAESIVARSHKSMVLISGCRLAQLMIEYDLGVNTEKIYKIKKVDTDFFPEE